MKTHLAPTSLALAAAALLAGTAAHAQFLGVNAVSSNASIVFDDTNSFNPFAGGNLTNTNAAWGGLLHVIPLTTFLATNDKAEGQVSAASSGSTYSLLFPLTTLTQDLTSTGFADLDYQALVEFPTGLSGYTGGATIFPNFVVSGTVQPGGFAFVNGSINYYSRVLGAVPVLQDTVTYSMIWNNTGSTPISFTNVTVAGAGGSIPALAGFESLILDANIQFRVDPATITATSFSAPEPSSALLALLSAPLLLRRRRA